MNKQKDKQVTSEYQASDTNKNDKNDKKEDILSDLENPTHSEDEESFNVFWAQLPSQMKVGKKAALKHYRNSVKTSKDYFDLKTALDNYKQTDRFKRGVIQNGSTWLNNWRDWLEYKEQKPGDNGKLDLSYYSELAK